MKYDLEERTAIFAERIIILCKGIEENSVTRTIVSQLVRAGTSIGANYMEANGASSKKESMETKYWLRMLAKSVVRVKDDCKELWREAQEFTLIFSKIAKSAQ